jgi:DNA-binding transcriptional ArsR family regulator
VPSSRRPLRDPEQVARARQRLTSRSAQRSLERVQKVLCEPARLRIMQALTAGSLSVDDLAAAVDRAPAATSQHLRILRELGLVEGARKGTVIYYQLRPSPATEHVEGVLQALEKNAPTSTGVA